MQTYWSDIVSSGVKYMRVGGKDYDGSNMWSLTDLDDIIVELQNQGVTPIIQLPIDDNLTIAQNATNCSIYVYTINVTNGRGIQYWEIGNEPDGSYNSTYNTNAAIANYIRDVSTAMKGVPGQSGIKIIGPCLFLL
jgi:hypothetical protein